MLYDTKSGTSLARKIHRCESMMGVDLFLYLYGETVISTAKKYGVNFTPEQQEFLIGTKPPTKYSHHDIFGIEKDMRFFGLRYREDYTVLRTAYSIRYTLEGIPKFL
jgi:hypothetical protein